MWCLDNIFTKYCQVLNSIIVNAKNQTNDEHELLEIDRVKRIINLCPVEERFIRTKDKVWAAREYLLNKNIDYFLKKDYSKIIKKDNKQTLIESILECTKTIFLSLSKEEQNVYWQKGAELIKYIVEYKQLIGDYDA